MAERVKIEGASGITGVPVGTLRFWRATNQGPRSYVVGRRLWYDVADLVAWLDEEKAQSVRGGVRGSGHVDVALAGVTCRRVGDGFAGDR